MRSLLSGQACTLTDYRDSGMLDTLGSALALSGQREKAREVWERALALAEAGGAIPSAQALSEQLATLE